MTIMIAVLFSCSTSRYILTDKNKDKYSLSDYIHESHKNNRISKRPLIAIDGKPYGYDIELKNGKLPISKEEIAGVMVIKHDVGVGIWGEYAQMGVLVITTKSYL